MTQRDFEVKLGLLVMESLANGLTSRQISVALASKLEEELRIQASTREAAKSY